ncbi:MAG TPA: NAD(P)-dependent oxidoreductase [Candidatus Binatia bacterium]|nr:NAD(P)-dependent oxidoreductase [Candidatus Binatia bacterium]
MTRVGIVGLGIMGSAYAEHTIAARFPTIGADIAPDAVQRFKRLGGQAVASPADVAAGADVVLSALPSVAALDDAFFGPRGIAAGAHPGLTVLEMSTFPLDAKERARVGLLEREVTMLDCPVSGTGSQARNKDLAVYASGDRDAFDASLHVLEAIARSVRFVGAFGMGSKLKYIANLLVTIHNLSTAEAIVLGQKAGIEPQLLFEVIADSAGTSRMFTIRGPMMLRDEYDDATMKLDLYQKDIEIIAEFARSLDVPTPLFSTSALFYTAALADGRAKQDTAAIAAILKRMAGLR